MKLASLAEKIGARRLTPGRNVSVAVDQVYAGDRISDLLNAAGEHALIVTNLASNQLTVMAGLLDVPSICLVNGQTPDDGMLRSAQEHSTAILVSPAGVFETCGRIYRCLTEEEHQP
jgi:hypothetical protein